MANNPANDRYNPKSTTEADFETFRFSEIPEGQLFWRYNDKRSINWAFRKINDKQQDNAMNTQGQVLVTIDSNDVVYQKN